MQDTPIQMKTKIGASRDYIDGKVDDGNRYGYKYVG